MVNKLRNRFGKDSSFTESFSFLNAVAFYGSWVSNISDIVLMIFFIYPTLVDMAGAKSKFTHILLFVLSALFLFIFEVLKRTTIYEALAEFQLKGVSVKFKSLLLAVLIVISTTGFMAISGTQEIAFKKTAVVESTNNSCSQQEKEEKDKAEIKKKAVEAEYAPLLKSSQDSAWLYKSTLTQKQTAIDKIDSDLNKEIATINSKCAVTQAIKLESGEDTLLKAIVITIAVEFFIIVGVLFNCKYDYEELREEEIENKKQEAIRIKRIKELKESPEYGNWNEDRELLKALYKVCYKGIGAPIGKYEKLRLLLDKSMQSRSVPRKKEFETFLDFLKQYNVVTGDRARLKFTKPLSEATEILTTHYGMEELKDV